MRRALGLVALLVALPSAVAEPVALQVREVAGETAYLDRGRRDGLVPGMVVTIKGERYEILEATQQTASVRAPLGALTVGARGVVDAIETAAPTLIQRRPAPRPPSTWVGQWLPAVAPARLQQVTPVPLGGATSSGDLQLAVWLTTRGAVRVDAPEVTTRFAEARVIASYAVLPAQDLAIDADLAVRLEDADLGVLLRTAQLRLGEAYDPTAAVGRLRWASSTVGMLDGARARWRHGAWEVAGYGGVAPDPISGAPSVRAARFGAEVAFDRADATWQPRLALELAGSTWGGVVDEQRAHLSADGHRDGWHLRGWSEAQLFRADNPWGAAPVELTNAGLGATWRRAARYLSVDARLQRPERSLRLTELFGLAWTCAPTPQPGDVDETCAGGDRWLTATANAGTELGRVMVDAGASVWHSRGSVATTQAHGFVRAETGLAAPIRGFIGASGVRGGFVEWIGGDLGLRWTPRRQLAVGARYRGEARAYIADVAVRLAHQVAADAQLSLRADLDLGAELGIWTDEIATAGYGALTVAWRPFR